MGVEARLLLYAVAAGALATVVLIVAQRLRELFVHAAVCTVLHAGAVTALVFGAEASRLVAPVSILYAVLCLAPPLGVLAARSLAAARRHASASAILSASAFALGRPRYLRREAGIYAAFARLARGEESRAVAALRSLSTLESGNEPEPSEVLAAVLPPLALGRWEETLAAVDAAPRSSVVTWVADAHAAAETGDLRRAFRSEAALRRVLREDSAAVGEARRAILAAAGRHEFLAEARRRELAVADTTEDTFSLAHARALEGAGERDAAALAYAQVRRRARGVVRIRAEAGEERCRAGRPVRHELDEIETAAVHDLEIRCLDVPVDALRRPLHRRAPAIVAIAVVTVLASVACLVLAGGDDIAFAACGGLSHALVAREGAWPRLFTAVFLHGNWAHLLMNLATLLPLGAVYEARAGSMRLILLYLGSGVAASAASVWIAGTPLGIGASGAAMGLIGGVGILLWRQPHLFPSTQRRSWCFMLGASLAASAVIGWIESEVVDNTAHGAGLVAGALIAFALLPRPAESELGRAARRLAAGAAIVLALIAGTDVVRKLPRWFAVREVNAAGVRVSIPAWLVVERAGEGLGGIAERSPLPFLVQFGLEPHAWPSPPAALRRLAGEVDGVSPAWTARGAFPAASDDPDLDERVFESPDAAAAGPDGERVALRVTVLRRSGAFAVIVRPDGADAERTYGAAVREITRTLVRSEMRSDASPPPAAPPERNGDLK